MPGSFALKNAGFEHALIGLRHRHQVARECWDGWWLTLQLLDEDSKVSPQCIFLNSADGSQEPWDPPQEDILATDWLTVR